MKPIILSFGLVAGCALLSLAAKPPAPAWDAPAAAKYLDDREVYWQNWEHAERDHETHCVSCHTQLPYVLCRPLLRDQLQERNLSAPEQKLLSDVNRRVTLWAEVEPSYTEPKPTRGPQALGTESVLNALILTSYDSQSGHLRENTRKAFDNAWKLQVKSGPNAGSWNWLNFQNDPWEGVDSAYQGATFFAFAVGLSPDNYRYAPAIQPPLFLLRAYLRIHYAEQPLANKLVLLWASSKVSGLLTRKEQRAVAVDTFALQQPDGGWSLSSFGKFKRRDSTELETMSDGYATGLAVLAIEQTEGFAGNGRIHAGLDWLRANQNKDDGSWSAYSLNKKRDLKTNVGRFMADAATGFAVTALAESNDQAIAKTERTRR